MNLFDRISIESEKRFITTGSKTMGVSKILIVQTSGKLDLVMYSILTNAIGRDLLKESVRIQQIRDIYGIRAVDEIRKDSNIS